MYKYVISLLVLAFCSLLSAHENSMVPFKLKTYSIKEISSKDNSAEISLEFEVLGNGNMDIDLRSSEKMEIVSGEKTKLKLKSTKGSISVHKWITRLPKDGYYFIEAGLRFYPDTLEKGAVEYAKSQAFILYYEIKNGAISKTSLEPDERYIKPEVKVNRFPNEQLPLATFVPFDSSRHSLRKTIISKPNSTNNYSILIQVSGYIQTNNYAGLIVGVPDVAVYLDWDYDNDVNTGYTPYSGGGQQHVEYAKTDMSGYYYFSFIFDSPNPANYYSPRIRVSANCANSAGYNLSLGQGAKLPTNYYFDISTATNNVYSSSANILADAYNGSALRYLYRAKIAAINAFSVTPAAIRYFINTNINTSFFARPGADNYGYNLDAPRILFNEVIWSETGYHEYGHYLDWAYAFLESVDYSGTHWFTLQTTSNLAWIEGWAEFYCAAAHMYWYNAELPSTIEANKGDNYTGNKVYQFMDYSQSVLNPNQNNTQVEGAVACFLYSLWDNETLRAPGYSGDNDDVSFSGNYILTHLTSRYTTLGSLRGSSQIEAFKNGLLTFLDTQNSNAVTALYNAIILRSGIQHSATPTSLSISGNSNSRTLSWNDNTCPNSVSYIEAGKYYPTPFDLFENQESGFKIYRKASSGSWDGTLNGYTLVTTTPANQTSWVDNSGLVGQYSYVVVAYNSGGESLPKAQQTVNYPMMAPVISGFTQTPSVIYLYESGTVTCNLSQGNGNLTYSWTYANKPTSLYVSFSGNTAYIENSVLAKSSPSQLEMNSVKVAPFSITCTVTNSVGSSSSTYYPSYSNYQSSSSQLMVENNALFENYPNPFNPSTLIKYQIKTAGMVSLKVYDILGSEVASLVNEIKQAGVYVATFNASNLPSGIYIYTFATENFKQTKKMLLIR